MLDTRFINFCRADSLFYDAPATESVGADFHEGRTLPEGWTATRGREWTVCVPPDSRVPDQGWKIHVAASPDNAAGLLDTVAPYCVEHGLMYKYISDSETLARRGSKYGDRSASGKFITVYPADETELERALDGLEQLVGGTRAPSILSDLRWREGPLHVRYGGFVLKTTRLKDGTLTPAITTPDGELVPDERRPGFHTPSWVTIPSFLREALAERRARTLGDFPFRVYKALHFSNGGGVYRAVDKRDGSEVLLKEARPFAGLDAAGDDAVARLDREQWALSRLAGLPSVPALRDVRKGNEHHFLARDFVDGTPLTELVRLRHPYGTTDNTPRARAEYADWALRIIDQVAEAVAAMHERGVVFGDLHPGNILVDSDDTVAFIDMETATPAEEMRAQAMGSLGFRAPDHLRGPAVDLFALDVLRLTMFVPMPHVVPWGTEKIRTLIDTAVRDFPLPESFARQIERGLGDDVLGARTEFGVRWPAAGEETGNLIANIAASIVEAATPERTDRLYPGDVSQFIVADGGVTFAYGAAGVLWALHRAGAEVPAEHVEWLLGQAGQVTGDGPGFFTGLAGIAYTLDELGHPGAADAVMERAFAGCDANVATTLATGLSGLGLTALHLAARRGDDQGLRQALQLADRLPDAPAPQRIGLLHGRCGSALLLLRLYENTGDGDLLKRAVAELHAELELIERADFDDRFLSPGLEGSAGIVLALRAALRHTPDDERMRTAVKRLVNLRRGGFATSCGLLHGRAGEILALENGGSAAERDVLGFHLEALGWEAIAAEPGRVDFLGNYGYRLSTDLGTGSAGVLLSLTALRDGIPALPFLAPAVIEARR
ncbi:MULTISPECIES: class III lanthionine synthetase LanKC [Streptomyces]|uniref:non-specific serine/threonine protein kinase n=1 Tax=Streptomyces koelreuteriae TaxID=2838015 RepID=A0ABX8FT24_9ACTN|nr:MULTISPECIES: class III lanthionine synthetase LanKC [Streptomyces]QWB24165.1 class III lanthionine synthetase LanKC [Streptomyces koelreuteriae]UUA07155.1 class III lanthionine synthetase LanKC [Streptomyces koelreuteriae]UUA14784.1 class III lanthionine synthetase LanKC [Streptomyces sp. CRCS-T-1]